MIWGRELPAYLPATDDPLPVAVPLALPLPVLMTLLLALTLVLALLIVIGPVDAQAETDILVAGVQLMDPSCEDAITGAYAPPTWAEPYAIGANE